MHQNQKKEMWKTKELLGPRWPVEYPPYEPSSTCHPGATFGKLASCLKWYIPFQRKCTLHQQYSIKIIGIFFHLDWKSVLNIAQRSLWMLSHMTDNFVRTTKPSSKMVPKMQIAFLDRFLADSCRLWIGLYCLFRLSQKFIVVEIGAPAATWDELS